MEPLLFLSTRLVYIEILYRVNGKMIDVYISSLYTCSMKKQRGRPPKDIDRLHSEVVLVRLETGEKEAFKNAAELAGIPLSAWVRERLRRIAVKELESAKRPVPFLKAL